MRKGKSEMSRAKGKIICRNSGMFESISTVAGTLEVRTSSPPSVFKVKMVDSLQIVM